MAASMHVLIDGFRFNACWGLCGGQCIAPDCSDDYTREAVLSRSPEFLIALSEAIHDMDDIMILMGFWQLDPEANCTVAEYQEAAQQMLQSPYASEYDRAGAQKALNWSPCKRKRHKEPQRREHGFVYVIRAPAMDPALYKIGRALVIKDRIDHLGIKLPWSLEVIVNIETDDYIGLEAELHRKFVDKRDKGEWFRLTEEDIAYIRSLKSGEVQTNLCPE